MPIVNDYTSEVEARVSLATPSLIRHYVADQREHLKPERLPLAMAWAIQAAGTPAANHDSDPALAAPLVAARDSLDGRAWELWQVELARWTAAARAELASMSPEGRTAALREATQRLQTPFTMADADVLATLTLVRDVRDAKKRFAAAVAHRVPAVTALRLAGNPAKDVLCLPSETIRIKELAARADLAPLRGWLAAEEIAPVLARTQGVVPRIADEAQKDIAQIVEGKLRELNPHYAKRLGEIDLDVMRAALALYRRVDPRPAVDPDSRVRVAAIVAAWPKGQLLAPEGLNAVRKAIEEKADRLADPHYKAAEARRRLTARAARPSTPSTFLRTGNKARFSEIPRHRTEEFRTSIRERFAAAANRWGGGLVTNLDY